MRTPFILLTAAMLVGLAGGIAHFQFRQNRQPVPPEPKQFSPVTKKISNPPADRIASTENSESVSADELLARAIHSVTSSPGLALALGRQLLAVDPTDERGRAATLLLTLCNAGQFQAALAFVGEAQAGEHPDWLKLVFTRWGESHPQDAVKSLDVIADPRQRSAALRALADGWNAATPSGLAAYAVALPQSDDRDYALGAALDNWSLQDPAGLAVWLNTLPRGIEFDVGAAMMVIKSDSVNRTPELAMQWVENINDPAIKRDAFLHVLDEWAQTDSTAARRYVATAVWLEDSQRKEIWGKIAAVR